MKQQFRVINLSSAQSSGCVRMIMLIPIITLIYRDFSRDRKTDCRCSQSWNNTQTNLNRYSIRIGEKVEDFKICWAFWIQTPFDGDDGIRQMFDIPILQILGKLSFCFITICLRRKKANSLFFCCCFVKCFADSCWVQRRENQHGSNAVMLWPKRFRAPHLKVLITWHLQPVKKKVINTTNNSSGYYFEIMVVFLFLM